MSLLKKIEFNGKKIILRFLTSLFPYKSFSHIQKIKSVIITRIDERLGNVVLLNSVIQSFIKNNINTTIVVCKKYGSIFEGNKAIKKIIYFEKKKLFNPINIFKLIKQLRETDYDLLFDASNPNDLSTLTLFTIVFIKAKIKYGFKRKSSESILNKSIPPPASSMTMMDHYKLLFRKMNLKFYSHAPLIFNPHLLQAYHYVKEKNKTLIIAHPGGRGYKKWDIGKMLVFLKKLDPHQFKIIIILGPDEKNLIPILQNQNYSFIIPKNMEELISILLMGQIYIGNDSGPMHLAASLGLAVLAIFKPDASIMFRPRTKNYELIISPTPFDVPVNKVLQKFKALVKKMDNQALKK